MSNENRQEILVGGFAFDNPEEAKQAKREEEGVFYIHAKVDMGEPEMVLQIYNKMVQQKLFETAVGYSYLKELQEYLKNSPMIYGEDILPIPVQHPALESDLNRRAEQTEHPRMDEARAESKAARRREAILAGYKKRVRIFAGISAVLAVCVVAMFVITMTSSSTTILNYETELINKYEAWEQELSEREAAILEKEEELGIGQD